MIVYVSMCSIKKIIATLNAQWFLCFSVLRVTLKISIGEVTRDFQAMEIETTIKENWVAQALGSLSFLVKNLLPWLSFQCCILSTQVLNQYQLMNEYIYESTQRQRNGGHPQRRKSGLHCRFSRRKKIKRRRIMCVRIV